MVLPVPGGPQKITEPSLPALTMRLSMPCSPRRWSWPTTSASDDGRKRSASGRGALSASPAASNNVAMALSALNGEIVHLALALEGQAPAARRGSAP